MSEGYGTQDQKRIEALESRVSQLALATAILQNQNLKLLSMVLADSAHDQKARDEAFNELIETHDRLSDVVDHLEISEAVSDE